MPEKRSRRLFFRDKQCEPNGDGFKDFYAAGIVIDEITTEQGEQQCGVQFINPYNAQVVSQWRKREDIIVYETEPRSAQWDEWQEAREAFVRLSR